MDRLLPSYTNTFEKGFLVGVYSNRRQRSRQETSLEELVRLAETAGAEVCEKRLLELRRPEPATYLGKGKVASLAQEIVAKEMNLVLFDEELTPTQTRNLEKAFGVKVIDRTGLILDIFARRARSREGKIQVELAQLRYLLPRLVGRGKEFSQLAGGIGTRGPGETRLEMDRRKARTRLTRLEGELRKVRSHRELQRSRRADVPITMVALVGYTNAGKSTLMNRLTGAGVLVEDKLFATLDPTVRRRRLPSGRDILLVDAVGFVRKLPHQLVTAFRATFEEIAAADLLLHVIDFSHPDFEEQRKVVHQVLRDLQLDRKPRLQVFNKIDQVPPDLLFPRRSEELLVSAKTGEGIDRLVRRIEEELSRAFCRLTLRIPHQAGSVLSLLYRTGRVLERQDLDDGVHLVAEVDAGHSASFRPYEEE